jgi:hypothetical protein
LVAITRGEQHWAVNTDHTRLCFSQRGDRWGHLLVIGVGGRRRSFTDAAEQDEQEADGDPIRPVFQEIDAQTSGDGVTFLLVGRHGPAHFSASFHVSEWATATECGTRVQAEVAARCRRPGLAFASGYRVYTRQCSIQTVDSRRIRWSAETDEPVVSLVLGSPTTPTNGQAAGRLTLSEEIDLEFDRTDWLVGIEPTLDHARATQRWAYCWEFSTSRNATGG